LNKFNPVQNVGARSVSFR